jgi:multicomponent Na+:H+ antiporter subunit D
MSAAALLPVPVAVTLVGGVAAPLAAWLHPRLSLIVGLAALGTATGFLAYVDTSVFGGSGTVVVQYFGAELPFGGQALGIAFAGDPFGLTFATLTAVLGFLLLISLLSEFGDAGRRELAGLAALVQMLLAAIMAAALTADLVNLFVWFEVAALCSYGLTGFFLERPIALEAAFKNLVLTSSAGFAVFAGAGMIYSSYGALNFGQLHNVLPSPLGRTGAVALALLVGGFATKAGVMPFHAWLPDAHPPVPGGVSALFSGLMVNLGVIALARLSLQVFTGERGGHVLGLLTTIGAVSAVLGAALALAQDDLKRLLAWDTVSQVGIAVAGFASANVHGVAGAVYHLVNHGIFKALLFLCAGSIVHSTGVTKLSEMGGLARARPFTTAAFTVGALAISGIPPLNGYPSLGLLHDGLRQHPAVFAFALLAQALTVAALGRACWLGFYRKRTQPYQHMEPLHGGMRVSLGALAVGCVAFGVFAEVLVSRVAGPAASILLHPDVYAGTVLRSGGVVPASHLSFDWAKAEDYAMAAGEVLAGLVVLALFLRKGEPRPLSWLRRLHTGSANDYASFLFAGFAVTFVALAA